MEAFVYCWTDLGRGMLYIGSHKGGPDDGYICSSRPMMVEYKKRPKDFTREIVASGTFLDMRHFEQVLIESSGAVKNPHYYNQAMNAGPFYRKGSYSHTPETRKKLSVARKRRIITPETRVRLSVVGKGRIFTPEHRARMSASGMGHKNHLGCKHSPEARMKIGAANTRRIITPETRAKMSTSAHKKYARQRQPQEIGGSIV